MKIDEIIHPHYEQMQDVYVTCRDIYDGERSVKDTSKAKRYLPGPEEESANALVDMSGKYEAYKDRAHFYNATARTIQGLVGLILRKPTQYELPDVVYTHDHIKPDSVKINKLIKSLLSELLLLGRYGILIDYVQNRKGEWYPKMFGYKGEQIVSWHEEDGELLYVLLKEQVIDQYGATNQYRELKLTENVYQVTKYIEVDGKFVEQETVEPTNRGKKLDYIPFVLGNVNGVDTCMVKPPLYDLVTTNVHHYQTSADLNQALHYLSMPQLVIKGMAASSDGKGQKLVVRPDNVLALGKDADAQFLEIQGSGLHLLQDRLVSYETLMASLGSRLLFNQKNGVEAAETVRINATREGSSLTEIVNAANDIMTHAYKMMAKWLNANGDNIDVEFNKDFVSAKLNPAELTALTQALLAGAFTPETFVANLQDGEMYKEGHDLQEEIDAIKEMQGDDLNLEV